MKIGIIQNAPRTGDFSNNLRHIVQGYRTCLDHGAEIVVASAHALCGPGLFDLAARDSFQQQMQLALQTLSRELGAAPLILGAYSTQADEDEEELVTIPPHLTPYLLENDVVEELENGEILEWEGKQLLITTDDTPLLPGTDDFDIIIHTAASPWYAAQISQEAQKRKDESLNNETFVVYAAGVGTAESHLYGGGSGVYSPQGKTLLRLPWFEVDSRVVNLSPPHREADIPHESEPGILAKALQQGIRDTVRQFGYGGVCLSMDFPHSTLLAALATDALGSANVEGVTFCGAEESAKELGISCKQFSATQLIRHASELLEGEDETALQARIEASLLSTYSESRGLLLLSPLSRRDIMLGQFSLYGESCGLLAPLGNLYEMDLHMLSTEYKERHGRLFGTLAEPHEPAKDLIIHALADCNVSVGRLIRENNFGLEENDVRYVQRRIIASALKRTQIPCSLQVSAPEEQLTIPTAHRLND